MGFERGILDKVAVENWVDFPVGGIVLQEEGRTGMVPVLSRSPSRVDSRDTCYKVFCRSMSDSAVHNLYPCG